MNDQEFTNKLHALTEAEANPQAMETLLAEINEEARRRHLENALQLLGDPRMADVLRQLLQPGMADALRGLLWERRMRAAPAIPETGADRDNR